jgi:hypothetical protein
MIQSAAFPVTAEDIRNLLQHNAPVASASPPTPADATGQHARPMTRKAFTNATCGDSSAKTNKKTHHDGTTGLADLPDVLSQFNRAAPRAAAATHEARQRKAGFLCQGTSYNPDGPRSTPDTKAAKALDTFDADMAELRATAERLYTLIAHTEDIDFARTLLAAHNIGCGITVPM